MAAQPTGTAEVRGEATYLVYHRQFTAPAEQVWEVLTDSEWLADWFGDRRVEREPNRRLVAEEAGAAARIELDLDQRDGVTRLVLAQPVGDDVDVEQVGPRWDYRLDRLARAVGGGDLDVVDFDDYYPALAGHYRTEVA